MGRWGSKASRTVSGTSSGSQPDAHRVIISTGHALPLGLAPLSPALTASSQHSSLLPASSSSHALYHVCHSLTPQVRDGHLVHTVEGAMGSKEDVVLPGRAQHTVGTTGASINPQAVSSLADRPLPSTRSDEGKGCTRQGGGASRKPGPVKYVFWKLAGPGEASIVLRQLQATSWRGRGNGKGERGRSLPGTSMEQRPPICQSTLPHGCPLPPHLETRTQRQGTAEQKAGPCQGGCSWHCACQGQI